MYAHGDKPSTWAARMPNGLRLKIKSVSFFGIGVRDSREQRQRCNNRCLANILRPTFEMLRTLISGASAGVSKLTLHETVSSLCSGPT